MFLLKFCLFERKLYDKILENILKFYDGGRVGQEIVFWIFGKLTTER